MNVLQDVLHAERIVQLIEAEGFLEDRDDPTSVVQRIAQAELADREAAVEGRMKRKMLALRKLFESGAVEVILADGRSDHPVCDALAGQGTVIR